MIYDHLHSNPPSYLLIDEEAISEVVSCFKLSQTVKLRCARKIKPLKAAYRPRRTCLVQLKEAQAPKARVSSKCASYCRSVSLDLDGLL